MRPRSLILEGMADLMFPRLCHLCHKGLLRDERFVCESCLSELPRIEYRSIGSGADSVRENGTLYRLSGALEVEKAVSWIYHNHHTPSAALLHDMKYRGFSGLARYFGRQMAAELKSTGIFTEVDCIVPIPLHPLRLMRRGYNQARMLAMGISDCVRLPVVSALKARKHRTQTRLQGEQRQSNVTNVFYADAGCPLFRRGATLPLRILLVDDVCTTGATLEQAAKALYTACPTVRINVLTFALAE